MYISWALPHSLLTSPRHPNMLVVRSLPIWMRRIPLLCSLFHCMLIVEVVQGTVQTCNGWLGCREVSWAGTRDHLTIERHSPRRLQGKPVIRFANEHEVARHRSAYLRVRS